MGLVYDLDVFVTCLYHLFEDGYKQVISIVELKISNQCIDEWKLWELMCVYLWTWGLV